MTDSLKIPYTINKIDGIESTVNDTSIKIEFKYNDSQTHTYESESRLDDITCLLLYLLDEYASTHEDTASMEILRMFDGLRVRISKHKGEFKTPYVVIKTANKNRTFVEPIEYDVKSLNMKEAFSHENFKFFKS